jgi:hypothetical protein
MAGDRLEPPATHCAASLRSPRFMEGNCFLPEERHSNCSAVGEESRVTGASSRTREVGRSIRL